VAQRRKATLTVERVDGSGKAGASQDHRALRPAAAAGYAHLFWWKITVNDRLKSQHAVCSTVALYFHPLYHIIGSFLDEWVYSSSCFVRTPQSMEVLGGCAPVPSFLLYASWRT
jgi:hypothetical protein